MKLERCRVTGCRGYVLAKELCRLHWNRADIPRELALELIKIGYRALAMTLHPDKGGSTEVMARLNKVKSILEGAL